MAKWLSILGPCGVELAQLPPPADFEDISSLQSRMETMHRLFALVNRIEQDDHQVSYGIPADLTGKGFCGITVVILGICANHFSIYVPSSASPVSLPQKARAKRTHGIMRRMAMAADVALDSEFSDSENEGIKGQKKKWKIQAARRHLQQVRAHYDLAL